MSGHEPIAKADPKPADDGGLGHFRTLSFEAYGRFHDALRAEQPNHPGLTGFEAADRAKQASGTMAWMWGASGEISEAINLSNEWGSRVHEWGAWNRALEPYEDFQDRLTLVAHFVEPVAIFCLLQPSSLGDRVRLITEALLHQANQRLVPSEPDKLAQDEPKPKPNRFLNRSERLAQLKRLGKPWSSFPALRLALSQLDRPDYQRATGHFRDLFAHSLPPRLDVGQVVRARRSIGPRMDLVEQPDGTFLPIEDPARLSVRYDFCAMPPLNLGVVREANLGEYRKALAVMKCLEDLVAELCDRMNSAPTPKLP